MTYGTSPVKRRRRTRAEIETLESAVYTLVKRDQPMTIRGIFYRVVSLGLVDKTENGYKVVQRRVLEMRRSGALPYEWISDGTRWQLKARSYAGVNAALEAAALSYRRNLWIDQPVHVELWSEKDAITGVISSIANEYDVPIMVARGFSSESFLYSTAQQLKADGRPAVIYQLGDHDPSGVLAWRDTCGKLAEFAPDVDLTFERIAVTPEQIEEFNLPTRPTKSSSHSRGFSGESVEVDALETGVLRSLVRQALAQHMPEHVLDLHRQVEKSERDLLSKISNYQWEESA